MASIQDILRLTTQPLTASSALKSSSSYSYLSTQHDHHMLMTMEGNGWHLYHTMKQRRVASQSVSPSTNFVGAAVYLNTGPEKEDFQGKVYAAIDKASEMSKKMYSKVIRMWSVADGASVFVKEIQTEKCIGALEAVSLNNDQNGILVIFKDGEMVMYNAELDDSVMICPSESHLLVKHSLVIHEQQAHLLMLLTGRSKNEQLAQSLSLQCSQGQWTIQQIQSMEVTLSSLDYVSLNAKSNTVAIMDQSSFELYPMNAPSRTVSVSILDNQRLLAFEYLSTNHILFITENSKKERHLIIADAHFGTLQGKQLLNDASQMTTKSSCYPALLVSELQKDEAQVIVSTVIKTSKHLECDIDMCPIYVPRFTLLSALGKSEPSTCQFSLVEEKYNPKSKILSVETVPVAKNQLVEQLVAGLSDFDLRFINTMDNCEGLFVPPHHIQRLLSIVFNPETINKCWYRESAQWMIQHGWTSSLSAPEADILDCLLEKKEWFLLADYLKSKTLSAAHLAKVIQQIIRQECLNDFKLYVQSLTEVESMKSKSAQWFYLNMVIESSKDEVLLARSLRKTLTHEDVQTIMNIVDDILASKKNRFELLAINLLSLIIDAHLTTLLMSDELQTKMTLIHQRLNIERETMSLFEGKLRGMLMPFAKLLEQDAQPAKESKFGKHWRKIMSASTDGVGMYAVEYIDIPL